MAAHPFGPIEKFLITAFKDRDSNKNIAPTKLNPIFVTAKRVTSSIGPPNAVWALVTPKVELKPSLLQNCSDFDVRVLLGWADLDLLSRGLGYRITFTMPAVIDPLAHGKPTPAAIKISVLDYFGDKVLANLDLGTNLNLKVKGWKHNYTSLLKFLSAAQTVVLQVSVMGVTIAIDSQPVKQLPLAWTQSSPVLDEFAKLIEFCTPILQMVEIEHTLHGGVERFVTPKLTHLADSLSKHHAKLELGERVIIGEYLLQLIDGLTNFGAEGATIDRNLELAQLRRKVEMWKMNQGIYPDIFTAKYIAQVCRMNRSTVEQTINTQTTSPGIQAVPKILHFRLDPALHEMLSLEINRNSALQNKSFPKHNTPAILTQSHTVVMNKTEALIEAFAPNTSNKDCLKI